MDLLEKRRYILNHLNEFTFTELEKELRAAEDNESVEDTLKDIIGYTLLMINSKRNKKEC